MAVVYFRIMSQKYHHDPYSAGGKSGRWNYDGQRMIYLASTPSLAMLEYITIKGAVVGKSKWYMITFEIPDKNRIDELEPADLPTSWNLLPHGMETREFGKQWAKEMASPFLKVPSARLDLSFYGYEHNLLVNPLYPALSALLKVADVREFNFLLGGNGG